MKSLLLALFFAVSLQASDRPASVADLFQTDDNLLIVTSPERVEVCLLYPKDPWFSRDLGKRKYKEGRHRTVPSDQASILSTALTDDASYTWDGLKACYPTYHARIKFYRDGHSVSIDICFLCDVLVLACDSIPFAGGNCDGASGRLADVILPLFPNDRLARRIREVRDMKEQQAEEERSRANKPAEPMPLSAARISSGVIVHARFPVGMAHG